MFVIRCGKVFHYVFDSCSSHLYHSMCPLYGAVESTQVDYFFFHLSKLSKLYAK